MGKTNRKRNRRTDLMELWTGCFLVLYLLYPGLSGFGKISDAKTWLFYALAGLLLLLGLGLLIRDLRGKGLGSLTGPQIAALAFLGFTLLSAALSPYGAKAWYNTSSHEAALTVSLYVLVFLILSRWGAATARLGRVLCWALGVYCLICLLQALGGNPLGLYPENLNFYDGYGVRYSGAFAGTTGNVDLVSALLALLVPMGVVASLGAKPRTAWSLRGLALACLAIMVWIRVLCGLVGLLAGGAVCLLVLCPAPQRKKLALLLGGLGAGALVILWAFDLPLRFLHELHELLHGRAEETFGSGRFYIWRQMLERVPDRLLVGVGPDAARFSGLSPFIRYDETGVEVARATITDAHCYPLHILYCQGLPALVSWLALVAQALVHWVRGRGDRTLAVLGSGLTCFLGAMLFCFSSVIIMPFFWVTLGLLEARAAALGEKQSAPPPAEREKSWKKGAKQS